MVRLIRAAAFALALLMAVVALRPFSSVDTFASEPTSRWVTLRDGDTVTRHETRARTEEEFLEELGIELHPLDVVRSNFARRMGDRTVIRIDRAFYVILVINGVEEQIKTPYRTTVGGLVNQQQTELDVVLLFDGDADELLDDSVVLDFTTWHRHAGIVAKSIPYSIEVVETPSLSQGVEVVRQEGVMGEIRQDVAVVYVGGEVYSREVFSEFIINPITHIIDRGIGGALGTLTDTSCPSFRYVRRITMNASAYTAGFNCTGKHPDHPAYRITASGREVEHGIVAVDTSVIPFGTRLYVEGYGFALAADRGSAIRGYMIDLFMEDIADALRFGRRDVTVFILDDIV
ncbi:MAG: 3D domain-containing protein [Defluviitaleaceae bacterium]|nr:3D domain-containing protein [Defluviitaleaceae bacterium]